MSNVILPLVILGSMGSSAAGIAYGIKTEWEFLGLKKEEEVYVAPVADIGGGGETGSLVIENFVIGGDTDDMTLLGEAVVDSDTISTISVVHAVPTDDDDNNVAGLSAMPVNCPDTGEDGQSALTGFTMNADGNYDYSCKTLENPGPLAFGKVGGYTSHRGELSDLHGTSAVCKSNQALLGFVLDQNKSGTKAGYRFDCIDLKGPAKVRTALTKYTPYDNTTSVLQLDSFKALAPQCGEDELLQGFALEKSGNNMRYIYRCVTPAYEAD